MNNPLARQWVSAKYENPLIVVAVFLTAILPWNISHVTIPGFSVQYIRWAFGQVRIINTTDIKILHVIEALGVQSGQALQYAYFVWIGASVVFGAAILLSVALFARERVVTKYLPIRAGKLGGALLVISGVGYGVANFLVNYFGISGIQIPLAPIFMLIFGAILLSNQPEDTENTEPHSGNSGNTGVDTSPSTD